jgi:hypothetical protein
MAAAIIAEITSASDFLGSRAMGEATPQLLKSFADGLISQINSSMSLSTPDATQIQQALASSPYGEENTIRIQMALDSKVLSKIGTPSKAPKEQYLKKFWNYCMQSDYDHLSDPSKSLHSKMVMLVYVANRVGLSHPNPQSLKWMLAFLLYLHYKEAPDSQKIYDTLQDLKKVVASERKNLVQGIEEYPDDPTDLSDELYQAAYPLEGPVEITINGINSLAGKIVLRSTNKLLKGSEAASANKHSTGTRLKVKSEVRVKDELHDSTVEGADAPSSGDMAYSDMPRHGDVFEQKLYASYKSQLWGHRSGARGVCLKVETQGEGALTVKQESAASNTFQLTPRVPLSLGTQCAGHVPRAAATAAKSPPKPPPKIEPSVAGDASADEQGESSSDLDEFAVAALKSMEARKKKTKQSDKAPISKKKKKTEPAKKEITKKDKKEPSSPSMKVKKESKKEPSGSPKKKVKKEEKNCATRAEALNATPGNEAYPAGVHYKGGAIYTSQGRKRFRCLKDKHDAYTETSSSWGTCRTKKEAWVMIIDKMDAYAKSKGKKKKK